MSACSTCWSRRRPAAAGWRDVSPKASAPGARRKGARFAYLQVVATNKAALPLYADLGFETVYSYGYRVP